MLQINFNPFPALASERLSLRQVTEEDVDEVFALRSDAEIMRYIPRPLAKSTQDALDHIAIIDKGIMDNESINWAIALKEDNKLIGMICLLRMQLKNFRSEIGYILHPDFHGKGIMNEALQTVLGFAFDKLNFHSLEAVIDPGNSASEKLLIKNDFVKEAHLKENEFYEGKFLDTVIYSRINPNKDQQ
jgi:[ribosomal protein S5]-alanine N-acetyltransferase